MILRAAFVLSFPAGDSVPDYDRDVRPILAEHCYTCHGPDEGTRKAGVRLDSVAEAVASGVLVPGDADASLLIERVEANSEEDRMPPPEAGRGLNSHEREVLRAWIADGAKDEGPFADRPLRRPPVPSVAHPEWCRNPVDAFVLAALEARGLEPSPPADRLALRTRLGLDLVGLPPSPEEADEFAAADPARDGAVVESLLASPHYGERQALPWLDAARYADSNGYQQDGDRFSWPWRDWLVRSFEKHRPLDRILIEMLAGDLLEDADDSTRLATAFLRMHPLNNEGGAIPDEVRFHYVVDRVHTVATVYLGLTLACAQCHDHKYEAVSQEEYYRFSAHFDNVDEDGRVQSTQTNAYHAFQLSEPTLRLSDPELDARIEAARAAFDQARGAFGDESQKIAEAESAWLRAVKDEELGALPEPIATAVLKARGTPLTGAEHQRTREYFVHQVSGRELWSGLQAEYDRTRLALADLEARAPRVMVMRERAERRPTQLHARGLYDQPVGEVLEPGLPAFLGVTPEDMPKDRLALARWLLDPAHPRTARVLVDRIWRDLFGAGLVDTPEDFGVQGARPRHPELLEWLTAELVESGFDLQHLQRLLVDSATYRQGSALGPRAREEDPHAEWWSRARRDRLSSLLIRDRALAVSGLLVRDRFGPPVYPVQPPGLWEDVSFGVFDYPTSEGDALHRRSLYTFWRRTISPPDLFDQTGRNECRVRPSRTNTPLHALVLWNDPVYVEAARVLASSVLEETREPAAAVARLFRRALVRPPTASEQDRLLQVFERELALLRERPEDAEALLAVGAAPRPPSLDPALHAALTHVARVVLNLDEFLCRP